ncbi:MAG: nicotinate (nicotinamide) nucleotide adenylyltransferase [Formosimonas sp.]
MNPPIGCYGGTFNPPHIAHFALAHAACAQLNLAQVRLIPAGQPWQKPQVLPAAQRVAMLQHALHDDAALWSSHAPYPLTLDTIEADLTQASYTIDTLKTLRARHPATPLVWIMGSDQLTNLHTWRDWSDLLNYAHIAVAQRAGHEVDNRTLPAALQQIYNAQLRPDVTQCHARLAGYFMPFTLPALHISSSAIRQAIANGQSPLHIKELHSSVAAYIDQNLLYRKHL